MAYWIVEDFPVSMDERTWLENLAIYISTAINKRLVK